MLRVVRCLRSAARSARARPLGASHGVAVTSSPAANALAFSTRAETTARNAADVRDLLRTRLSLTDAEVDKVERHGPRGARSTIEPKLGWLQRRLGLDAAQLGKMVVTLPALLGHSVKDNVAAKLDWLQDRLDLDTAQLKQMVVALPPLLSLSVENNMAPKLEFLAREIGLTRDELCDWVVKNPVTLGRSLEKFYRPRLEACRAAGVDAKRVLSYATRADKFFCEITGIDPEDLAAIRESQTRVLNDFSAARVVPCETGGKKLVASGPFPADAVLFRFTGELSPINIGDRSLQVGRAAHLLSVPPEEPWVYLNHSFEPTVSLIVDPVAPVATARTTEDLSDGAALTIDYTLHEWEMSGDGFVCSESGRRVRGFKHLSESEREAALPRAAPHIREMHLAAAED